MTTHVKKKETITQELPVQKCLTEQEPEYRLTLHLLIFNIQVLFSTFKFYFQHSSFIFNIQVSFLSFNFFC